MAGTPDSTVILHWDECQAEWSELSWRDWVRFRGFDESGSRLLADAEAGEHYFLVCVLGDRGELCNAIPHRYVMSADGRLVHGFDGLGAAERDDRGLGALQRTGRARILRQSAAAAYAPAAVAGDARRGRRDRQRRLLALPLGDRNLPVERARELALAGARSKGAIHKRQPKA